MPHNMNIEILRPIGAFLGAGLAFIADATIATPDIPWLGLLKEVGLPTSMLLLAVWGLRDLSRRLQELQEARVEDQKATLELYRSDMKNAEISRRELILEMRNQTNVIKEKP